MSIALVACTACAPVNSRVQSSTSVVGTKQFDDVSRAGAMVLNVDYSPKGVAMKATQGKICPSWIVETTEEKRQRINHINGAVLTLEWIGTVAALGAGGFLIVDSALQDDGDQVLAAQVDADVQRTIGIGSAALGALFGVAAVIDTRAAVDDTLPSRIHEKEQPNSRVEKECGSDAASELRFTMVGPQTSEPFVTPPTDASGDLLVPWLAMPAAWFEGQEPLGQVQVRAVDGVVGVAPLAIVELSEGRAHHADAAWEGLAKDDAVAVAAYHERFPGARVRKEEPKAPKVDKAKVLGELESALAAGDVSQAQAHLAILEGRIEADELLALQTRIDLAKKHNTLVAALGNLKTAVRKLEESTSMVQDVIDAQGMFELAKREGVSEVELASLQQRFEAAREQLGLRYRQKAETLGSADALVLLREVLRVQGGSELINRAIAKHSKNLRKEQLKVAKGQLRLKEYDKALGTLAQTETLAGADKRIDSLRTKISKSKARADKKEEDRLAALEKKRVSDERRLVAVQAREAEQQAKAEAARLAAQERAAARVVARAKAEEEAALRNAEKEAEKLAAAEERLRRSEVAGELRTKKRLAREDAKRIASEQREAVRLAKIEAARLTKERREAEREAKADAARRAKEGREAERKAKAEAVRLAREQREAERAEKRLAKLQKASVSSRSPWQAHYLEFRLAEALSEEDTLAKLPIPSGCTASLSTVSASRPRCLGAGCAAVPMRRVRVACGESTTEIVKSAASVWARCTQRNCDECRQQLFTMMAAASHEGRTVDVTNSCQVLPAVSR